MSSNVSIYLKIKNSHGEKFGEFAQIRFQKASS